MGKRRTNAPHRDRDLGSESEEEEVECEPEALNSDQLNNIKKRKKLIGKRRGAAGGESAGLGVFGALSKTAAQDDDKPAPSVFSGFKGFTAFKATTEPPATNGLTKKPDVGSMFSASATTIPKPTEALNSSPFSSSLFAAKPATETTLPKSNLFSQPANGEHKANDISLSKDSSDKSATAADSSKNSTSNNINETELNFINDLNVVYEKHYGKNKRVLKLPTETLGEDGDGKTEESAKKKYGLLLAGLNKHCAKWINKHVEEDPLIVLTPIFIDYFNYMILMEQSFYPNTFKSKDLNGGPLAKSNNPFNTESNIFKKINEDKTKLNGHKEETTPKFNGFEEKNQADKENEEAEKDKKLMDSSKNFANMIKTNQMNPISLSGSSTSNFSFKPTEKLTEKDSNLSTNSNPPSNFFKSATAAPVTFGSAATTTPKSDLFSFGKSAASEEPKKNLETIEPKKTTLPFSFGDKPAEKAPEPKLPLSFAKAPEEASSIAEKKDTPTTITPSLFGKASETSSSIFNKPAESTSFLFGKQAESTTPSLFGKSTDSPAPKQVPSSLFARNDTPQLGTTAPSSFLSKPSLTANPLSATKEEEAKKPSPVATAAPTFSSLMNANSNQSSGSTFKGFAGFGGSTPSSSIFSSAASTESATTDKPAGTGMFSFAGGAANSGGLFGTGTPTSNLFGAGSTFPAATGSQAGGQEEEEEYVPPKPETSDVKEEGAVYEKRTKLFYYNEKESKFVDRGIGNLYLKPINNGESTQLIIRADNKLANILLNVKLSKALPINKISAKDVSYLCIPNPPIPNVDSKLPCKFLFKVKTEDDAQELVDKLNELKK